MYVLERRVPQGTGKGRRQYWEQYLSLIHI